MSLATFEQMTMEQRSLYINNMSKEEEGLRNQINNYIKDKGYTRQSGITLLEANFFNSCMEDDFRNEEGFEEYYYSLDSECKERLKILFECMNHDLLLEMKEYKSMKLVEISLYGFDTQKPIHFDLIYNESLTEFIKAYINRNFRLKVTVEELLLKILELKNEN